MTEEIHYLNSVQAGRLLGLAPKTLARYRCMGTGPVFCRFGNRVRRSSPPPSRWAMPHPLPRPTPQDSNLNREPLTLAVGILLARTSLIFGLLKLTIRLKPRTTAFSRIKCKLCLC